MNTHKVAEPRRFRKKPVEVEAVQVTRDNVADVFEWVAEDADISAQCASGYPHLVIHTLEGDMRADVGDYVIRGVQGEFYPCKPDIFEATYEPVPVAQGGGDARDRRR